jgi:hypothetical protein
MIRLVIFLIRERTSDNRVYNSFSSTSVVTPAAWLMRRSPISDNGDARCVHRIMPHWLLMKGKRVASPQRARGDQPARQVRGARNRILPGPEAWPRLSARAQGTWSKMMPATDHKIYEALRACVRIAPARQREAQAYELSASVASCHSELQPTSQRKPGFLLIVRRLPDAALFSWF